MKAITFGAAFEFIRNGMNVKQDKSGDGLPITRIETISTGVIDGTRVGYAGLTSKEVKDWLLMPGDILFSHINSVGHLGKCALYQGEPNRLVHGMNLLCLRPREEIAEPAFIKYLIRSDAFRRDLAKSIKKAVNQASVSIADLRSITVYLPALPEQRRIAAILDQADALRAKRRQTLTQLDEMARALFADVIGDPGTNPKGWLGTQLGALCHVRGGKRLPKGAPYAPGPTQHPYIRVSDLSDGAISEANLVFLTPEVQRLIARYTVAAGEIVISIAGTIGAVAVVPNGLDGANLTENAAKLVAARSGQYDSTYLATYLRTPFAQEQIGARTGQVTIGKLALFRIEQLPVLLPPMAVQLQFSARLATIDALRRTHLHHAAELDALFASLQHRAFRGEL